MILLIDFKKIILTRLFFGIIFVPISFGLAQDVKTNLECVIESIHQIANWSADSLSSHNDRPVSIHVVEQSDNLSMFLQNQFIQGMLDIRDSIFVVSKIPEKGIYLSVIPLKATIRYTGLKSTGWFKDGTIDREVDVALSVSALDIENDKLIFQTTLESSKRDQFPHSQLDRVEKGMLLEKPLRPSRRGFRAYAAPALALITLCGTVYLFYSIRSQ